MVETFRAFEDEHRMSIQNFKIKGFFFLNIQSDVMIQF